MWILVLFDLPTETKKNRSDAAKFRKNLLEEGFTMLQFSIYARHCSSVDNMSVHLKRVKAFLPEVGQVGIMSLTDKQFADIRMFNGSKPIDMIPPGIQLEMF